MCFLPNPPSQHYDENYIEERGHTDIETDLFSAKKATANYYLSLLEKQQKPAKLLEIGCSTGITMQTAREMGWQVSGVEVNRAAICFAKNNFGIENILSGPLHKSMFPEKSFSAAIMLDVIEHIEQPKEFLEILKATLKPKGTLLIVTPNIDSLSARIMKTKWPHLFLEHVCLYSPKSIRLLFEKSGFKVKQIDWAKKYVTLKMLKKHLQCHPNSFLAKPLRSALKLFKGLENIVFPFNLGEMFVIAEKEDKK